MTILVTGSAGSIGTNFLLDWQAVADEPFTRPDKLTHAGMLVNLESLENDCPHLFVLSDFIGKRQLAHILLEPSSPMIIKSASESHVDRSVDSPEELVATNAVGTSLLADAALGYYRSLPEGQANAFRLLHTAFLYKTTIFYASEHEWSDQHVANESAIDVMPFLSAEDSEGSAFRDEEVLG